MHAHLAFLVRLGRAAVLTLLLVIVALGLLSCGGSAGGGRGGGGEVSAEETSAGAEAINRATFRISVSHTGNFLQNQHATYTVTVTNTGTAASSGNVQVNLTIPSGEALVSMTGTGWSVSGRNRGHAERRPGDRPELAIDYRDGQRGLERHIAASDRGERLGWRWGNCKCPGLRHHPERHRRRRHINRIGSQFAPFYRPQWLRGNLHDGFERTNRYHRAFLPKPGHEWS